MPVPYLATGLCATIEQSTAAGLEALSAAQGTAKVESINAIRDTLHGPVRRRSENSIGIRFASGRERILSDWSIRSAGSLVMGMLPESEIASQGTSTSDPLHLPCTRASVFDPLLTVDPW